MTTLSKQEVSLLRDTNYAFYISTFRDAYIYNATQYYLSYARVKDPTCAAFWYKRMQNLHRVIWYTKAKYTDAASVKHDICRDLSEARYRALNQVTYSEVPDSPYQRIHRLFPENQVHATRYPEVD